jgi:two-component system, OmpR family, sensor kinase
VTLRTRLLAALLALLAAVCVVVGVVSVLALDSFLIDRLDGQLVAAGQRLEGGPDDDDRPPPRQQRTPPPGLADGTLNALLRNGTLDPAGVISGSTYTRLTGAQQQVLRALPVDGRSYTRDLGGDLGDYRLRAVTAADGDVSIAGLPLSGVHETVTRLTVIIAAVAAGGLLLAGIAGALIVRLTLRPLRRVAGWSCRPSRSSWSVTPTGCTRSWSTC